MILSRGSNSNLLTSTVLTDPSGNFSVTGKYTCTAGQQIYLVALGGNPGGGVNAQAPFMASSSALGSNSTNVAGLTQA